MLPNYVVDLFDLDKRTDFYSVSLEQAQALYDALPKTGEYLLGLPGSRVFDNPMDGVYFWVTIDLFNNKVGKRHTETQMTEKAAAIREVLKQLVY